MNKRFFTLISILSIFFISACGSTSKDIDPVNKIQSGKDINFFVTTDIHYLSRSLRDDGKAFQKFYTTGAGKQLNYIDEIMDDFIYEIEREKPQVLIISGDLTTNGEKQSHIDLAGKLQKVEDMGTFVYVIPGNHDISNPWARSFKDDSQYLASTVSPDDFRKIYRNFGYGEAIMRDKDTLSYLAAPSDDLWLLMIDTNLYKNNSILGAPQTDGEISKDTYEWIKKCGAEASEKGAELIGVTHHSLLDHSEVIREGYTLNNNKEAIEVFKNLGININLSGHIHIQDISSYKENDYNLYDIATNALSVYPNQYGRIKYSPADSSYSYTTSKLDVEGWAREVKSNDQNLLNFSTYSKDFFGKLAYDMAYNSLSGDAQFSEEDKKSMSDVMEILNLRYFAGTEHLNSQDVVDSEGFKKWLGVPPSFHKSYILTIISDNDTDDNNLYIGPNNQ
ncbi:3',5'-cyclic adenosine monophosphate phosphodiesterase CpdA [Oxobacter pfennigii]|uniref:3',5'-cyclic adenosine monophosphate phosphodiesterase CpdA n=1 Tax=Oxobacter pfennigii TaxID=36849 RepID=A0A0P8W7V1_9CLOT|nr:metallophosphoesterase [Oxobacter pfennigii]KPU44747.1 3',5'-cyclic adenosine monophosphate phosphodiesterase CpdA [Oxobacter pfennigii]